MEQATSGLAAVRFVLSWLWPAPFPSDGNNKTSRIPFDVDGYGALPIHHSTVATIFHGCLALMATAPYSEFSGTRTAV